MHLLVSEFAQTKLAFNSKWKYKKLASVAHRGWVGVYLGHFLLGIYRWPPTIMVYSVANYRLILVTFGQMYNFYDLNFVPSMD